MKKIDKAFLLANHAHRNQSYGIFPYSYHLTEVYRLLKSHTNDTNLLVSAILHDILEDTDITFEQVEKYFGTKVAKIVDAVSDGEGNNRKERKESMYRKLEGFADAIIIKLVDRICNINNCIADDNKHKLKMYIDEHSRFSKAIEWKLCEPSLLTDLLFLYKQKISEGKLCLER